MADDFGDAIQKWYDQVEEAIKITPAEKAEITGAGAEAFAKELKAKTPVSSVNYGGGGKRAGHASKRKTKHLNQTVTYTAGKTADGNTTGDTDVGWSDHYFDFVARITNNGKRKMSEKEMANLHFVDKAQQAAKGAVQQAMLSKYKELKGGGDH